MPLTRRQTRMFDFDVREIGEGELPDSPAMGQALALSTIRLDARIGQISRAPSLSLSPETGVAAAMDAMCPRRQWHLPIVCARGLFLGALDITDLSVWLRDRMTLISVDAAFAGAG